MTMIRAAFIVALQEHGLMNEQARQADSAEQWCHDEAFVKPCNSSNNITFALAPTFVAFLSAPILSSVRFCMNIDSRPDDYVGLPQCFSAVQTSSLIEQDDHRPFRDKIRLSVAVRSRFV